MGEAGRVFGYSSAPTAAPRGNDTAARPHAGQAMQGPGTGRRSGRIHETLGELMTISIYDISMPAFKRGLTNLAALLDKAAAHATEKKFDPGVLVHMRLFPDMLPLSSQVQIACDMAKGAAARLGGVDVPKHDDTEVTLDDLKARIAKTLAFLDTITPAQLEGAEGRPVVIKTAARTLNFTGLSYLTDFVLPNLYFHVSTAYALLRSSGVEIGKRDYLGKIQ
jgi:hypothetical protein